jgi:hypothetical protein
MSKGSWNAQRGCFEPVVDQILHSPSVGERGQSTSVGTLGILDNCEKAIMPLPSPVDNQTTCSRSRDFYHLTEGMKLLMNVISSQLNALWTPAREQEAACLAVLKGLESELAMMSLSLASLICCSSSNEAGQTGSPKPHSPNASHTDSTHED